MNVYGQVKLTLRGLNVERFVNYAVKTGVEFRELTRDNNITKISVDYKVYKKTIKLAKNFDIEDVEYLGPVRMYMYLMGNIGIIIGLIIGLALFGFCMTRVWRIDILGLERINKESIVEILNQMDYNIGGSNISIDNKAIESALLENFDDISLVSVMHNGCSIVISIKEKEYSEELDSSIQLPVVASFDGIVESIDVVQGTPMVQVGDVVKKGDILIAPFTVDSEGNMIKMRAIGNVNASVYVKGSVSYQQGQERLVRSGNVQTHISLKLFGVDFPSKKNTSFDFYEVEKVEKYLCKNSLLPFIKVEERYYELIKQTDSKTFEEQKDYYIKQSIYQAYDNLEADFDVVSEQTDITKVENTYFVTTYLKVVTDIGCYQGG